MKWLPRRPWWRAVRDTSGVLVEPVVVEGLLRGPEEAIDGREHWDFEIVGYSERLKRPIARGWRIGSEDLQDEHVDLQRVQVQFEEWRSVALDLSPSALVPKRRYLSLYRRRRRPK